MKQLSPSLRLEEISSYELKRRDKIYEFLASCMELSNDDIKEIMHHDLRNRVNNVIVKYGWPSLEEVNELSNTVSSSNNFYKHRGVQKLMHL